MENLQTSGNRPLSPLLFDDPLGDSLPSNQILSCDPVSLPTLIPFSQTGLEPPHLLMAPRDNDFRTNSVVPSYHGEGSEGVQCDATPPQPLKGWGPVTMDPPLSQGDQQGAVVGIPESAVYPGMWGFKVHLPASKYSPSTNTLTLRPDELFPATFCFTAAPPPSTKNYSIRVLVCCKEPQDVIKLGPCRRCLRHSADDSSESSSKHFLLSTNSRAVYGVHLSHRIVTVPLDGLQVCEEGLTCLYKCVCHSACVVGRGRNRPTLIVIFSLIHNGNEIGRDVVNLRSCSNPGRKRKSPKKADTVEDCDPPFPKLARGQSVYDVDSDMDEEGYYNFTWRGKERILFDAFNVIKNGYENGPLRS